MHDELEKDPPLLLLCGLAYINMPLSEDEEKLPENYQARRIFFAFFIDYC